jgi:thymidine kinase
MNVFQGGIEMSKLYFRYGAMNSGKTTLLLQVAHNYEERDMKVVIIKPGVDTKGEDNIVTRIGLKRRVDHIVKKDEQLTPYLNSLEEDIVCVLVDEAQFLTRDQIDELFMFTKIKNRPVICYGLRSDFKTMAFPGSLRLFEVADEMEELYTICRCGHKAKFNGRIVNGEFTSFGDQVAIDGENHVEYESLCGRCYLEKVLGITSLDD